MIIYFKFLRCILLCSAVVIGGLQGFAVSRKYLATFLQSRSSSTASASPAGVVPDTWNLDSAEWSVQDADPRKLLARDMPCETGKRDLACRCAQLKRTDNAWKDTNCFLFAIRKEEQSRARVFDITPFQRKEQSKLEQIQASVKALEENIRVINRYRSSGFVIPASVCSTNSLDYCHRPVEFKQALQALQRKQSKQGAAANTVSKRMEAARSEQKHWLRIAGNLENAFEDAMSNGSWSFASNGIAHCGPFSLIVKADVINHQESQHCGPWCARRFPLVAAGLGYGSFVGNCMVQRPFWYLKQDYDRMKAVFQCFGTHFGPFAYGECRVDGTIPDLQWELSHALRMPGSLLRSDSMILNAFAVAIDAVAIGSGNPDNVVLRYLEFGILFIFICCLCQTTMAWGSCICYTSLFLLAILFADYCLVTLCVHILINILWWLFLLLSLCVWPVVVVLTLPFWPIYLAIHFARGDAVTLCLKTLSSFYIGDLPTKAGPVAGLSAMLAGALVVTLKRCLAISREEKQLPRSLTGPDGLSLTSITAVGEYYKEYEGSAEPITALGSLCGHQSEKVERGDQVEPVTSVQQLEQLFQPKVEGAGVQAPKLALQAVPDTAIIEPAMSKFIELTSEFNRALTGQTNSFAQNELSVVTNKMLQVLAPLLGEQLTEDLSVCVEVGVEAAHTIAPLRESFLAQAESALKATREKEKERAVQTATDGAEATARKERDIAVEVAQAADSIKQFKFRDPGLQRFVMKLCETYENKCLGLPENRQMIDGLSGSLSKLERSSKAFDTIVERLQEQVDEISHEYFMREDMHRFIDNSSAAPISSTSTVYLLVNVGTEIPEIPPKQAAGGKQSFDSFHDAFIPVKVRVPLMGVKLYELVKEHELIIYPTSIERADEQLKRFKKINKLILAYSADPIRTKGRSDNGDSWASFQVALTRLKSLLPTFDNYSDMSQTINFLQKGQPTYCLLNLVGILSNVFEGLYENPPPRTRVFVLDILGRFLQADVIEATRQVLLSGEKTEFYYTKTVVQAKTESLMNIAIILDALMNLKIMRYASLGGGFGPFQAFLFDFVFVAGDAGLIMSLFLSFSSVPDSLGNAPQWLQYFRDASAGQVISGEFVPNSSVVSLRSLEVTSIFMSLAVAGVLVERWKLYLATLFVIVLAKVPDFSTDMRSLLQEKQMDLCDGRVQRLLSDGLVIIWPLRPCLLLWPIEKPVGGRVFIWSCSIRCLATWTLWAWILTCRHHELFGEQAPCSSERLARLGRLALHADVDEQEQKSALLFQVLPTVVRFGICAAGSLASLGLAFCVLWISLQANLRQYVSIAQIDHG
eukprot:TRINITY_DN36678_c0_g1_i1.p1 TRINITY_DN36678_c0_g1~~TRINITY_DN36678_c0_g1_i1.p1  ORF type:complete len:1324 (+),score=152.93 TRINITY_DN36678_c0_g1_i1:34-4005(+)